LLWCFCLLSLLLLEAREFAREIPVEISLSIATEWEVKDIEAAVCWLNGSNAESSTTYWKPHPKKGNPLSWKSPQHLQRTNWGKTPEQDAPLHHRDTSLVILKFLVTGWWSRPKGRDSKERRKYIFLKLGENIINHKMFLTKCFFLICFISDRIIFFTIS